MNFYFNFSYCGVEMKRIFMDRLLENFNQILIFVIQNAQSPKNIGLAFRA